MASKRAGDYQAALRCYREALECARWTGEAQLVFSALINLGNIYREWGDAGQAWAYYTQADDVAAELSSQDRAYVASAASGLALDQGDHVTALEAYAEAFHAFEQAGNLEMAAATKHNVASVIEAMGRPHEALPLYEEAFALGKGHRLDADQAQTLCQIGVCWHDMGVSSKAVEIQRQALELASSGQRAEVLGNVLHNLGVSELDVGEKDAALDHLRLAGRARLFLANQGTSRNLRISARQRYLSTAGMLADALCERGRWREALSWIERVRARELAPVTVNGAVAEEYLAAQQEFWRLDQQQDHAPQAATMERPAAAEEGAYRQALLRVRQWEEAVDARSSSPSGKDIDIGDLAQYLEARSAQQGETILVYLPSGTQGKLLILIVRNGKVTTESVQVGARHGKEWEELANDLAVAMARQDHHEADDLLDEIARSFVARVLPRAVEDAIQAGQRLALVPWGAMHNLPLEIALVHGQRLGLRVPIYRYFSVGHMKMAETLPAAIRRKRALIVADPTVDLPLDLPELGLHLDCGGLPGAWAEGHVVADLLTARGWRVDRLFRTDATVDRFLDQVNRTSYDVIHLAAHAVFDANLPEQSALMMRSADGRDVHTLTAAELGLRLRPQPQPLVVLSACHSGGVVMRQGDEPDGLLRAFFSAGAVALVVSGWPLRDAAGAVYMKAFYEDLAAGRPLGNATLTARRATQQAMHSRPAGSDCSTTAEDGRATLEQWAAFRIYGSGISVFA